MTTEYLGTGLRRVADVGLATGIAAQHLAASVGALRTSGYSVAGKGGGSYVSDALATAALAAAHPRFCKQSLDGRYWRLALDGGVLDAMSSGALATGADDYAALQAAINYAQSFGSATIRFPAGTYPVSASLEIVHGRGINMIGAGPDNTIISAGAFPALKTRGLWRSRFEGMSFWCNANTTSGAFELDGEPDGSFGTQGNVFTNCYFFGNYNSKYTFTVCRISGGNGQGSENVWTACGFAGTSATSGTACLLIAGNNALQNTVIGCNFQSFITGVKLQNGAIDVLHSGFQSTYGYAQIAQGGWDLDNSTADLGDTVTMTGCRTESLRIYRGGGARAQITGFAYITAAVGAWGAGQAKALDTLVAGTTAAGNIKAYRCTTAGITAGTVPTWPETGTVSDGSVVWTQLDYNVFQNIAGTLARGKISYGQVVPATGSTVSTELRDLLFSRVDAIEGTYADIGADPLISNCTALVGGAFVALKINVPAQYGFVPAAGTTRPWTFNIGNRFIVATGRNTATNIHGYDMEIGPVGQDNSSKVKNFWGITGGWGFAQITFAELASITREGVTYYVTDGSPGTSPLSGGGAGCLATYQNGAWRSLGMGSAGGLSDGDKGDITVTSGGTIWTIDNGAVSLAKMADVATGSLLYRRSAGSGAPEVQSIAILKSDLGLTGINSGDQTSIVGITGTKAQFDTALADGNFLFAGDVTQYTDEMAQDAIGAIIDGSLAYVDGTPLLQRAALTGDVTAAAGSNATTIADDAVTNARLANVATATIKGRASAGTGDPEDLSGAQVRTLINVADGASANSPDATLLDRANHTGTQLATTISDFTEASQDVVGAMVAAAGGSYDDGAGTITLPSGSGSPGGSSGEVQYNNGGAFAGAANVEIDAGNLKLVSTTEPAAPSGGITLYSKLIAGRHLPKIIGPSGIDTVMQVGLHGNSVAMAGTAAGTGGMSVFGIAMTQTGNQSQPQTFASANRWQATLRRRNQTNATAGSSAGVRTAYAQWFRGNAAGFGGFFFRTQFGQNLNVNGAQCFTGLCASTAALATSAGAVAALVNMIGVGYDTTDASTGNWFLYRNDGSGTATKVDLGATEAARNTTHGYDLIIYCPPGAATEIWVRIVNLHTGNVVIDTSYTTDIPAVNTGMAFKHEVNNGAVASAANLEVAKVYIESDY